MLKMKEIDKDVNEYEDVFVPSKFDSALKVVNFLGGLNETQQFYSAPATSTEMGTLLKKVHEC